MYKGFEDQQTVGDKGLQALGENGVFPGSNRRELEAWRDLAFKCQFKASRLAALCGVSIRTLQRHFALNADVTVTVWLQSVRLDEAYTRLRAGSRVKEVAYDLGYTQLSHFSREFKKVHGIAPTLLNGSLLPFGERILLAFQEEKRGKNGSPLHCCP